MADMRLLMLAIIHQLQSGKSKLKQLQQARTAKYHECSGMLRAADSFGIPTTVPSRLAYFRKSSRVPPALQQDRLGAQRTAAGMDQGLETL